MQHFNNLLIMLTGKSISTLCVHFTDDGLDPTCRTFTFTAKDTLRIVIHTTTTTTIRTLINPY